MLDTLYELLFAPCILIATHLQTNLLMLFVMSCQEVSQDLRMSLEEKARKGGSAPSHARGKRKMKRGQAKTLSDLPKLNT